MAREQTEIGAIYELVDPTRDPESVPDMDNWFIAEAAKLGVEQGSGSVAYWPVEDGLMVELACRVDGIRIDARSWGATSRRPTATCSSLSPRPSSATARACRLCPRPSRR